MGCERCGRPYDASGGGCDPTPFPDGTLVVRFGQERGRSVDSPSTCHDCGVSLGQPHHLYCDLEQCPKCGGQLLGCPCWVDWHAEAEPPPNSAKVH
jgi:hypothetical protein